MPSATIFHMSASPTLVSGHIAAETPAEVAALLAWRDHGDRGALESIFVQHVRVALNLAHRRLGNLSDAEDAVQEAFTTAMRTARNFDPAKGSVRSWLLAIVLGACADQQRARRRRRERERQAPAQVNHHPDPDLPELITLALAELPEHQRIPIELRYLADLSFTEISAATHRNEGTLRKQVERGLEALRVICARRGLATSVSAVGVVLTSLAQPLPGSEAVFAAATSRCVAVAVRGPVVAAPVTFAGMAAWVLGGVLALSACGVVAVGFRQGWFDQRITTGTGQADLPPRLAVQPEPIPVKPAPAPWSVVRTLSREGLVNTSRKVFYSGDGCWIGASAGKDGLRLWHTQTGEIKSEGLLADSSSMHVFAIARDGSSWVCGNWLGFIQFRKTDKIDETVISRGHDGEIDFLVISPDGTRAMSAGRDDKIRIWDTLNSKELASYQVRTSYHGVPPASFSRDGNLVVIPAVSRDDKSVIRRPDGVLQYIPGNPAGARVLLASNGVEKMILADDQWATSDFATFLAEDRYILTSGTNIYLWDAHTGGLIRKVASAQMLRRNGDHVMIPCIAPGISQDGSRLVIPENGTLAIVETLSGKPVCHLRSSTTDLYQIPVFSPDGRFVAAVDRDHYHGRVWDAHTGELVRDLPESESLQFSPSQPLLLRNTVWSGADLELLAVPTAQE